MGVQINGDTGNISATKADYSGNVTIGGTLTYEDVTNVDSIGIVTARNGIEVGARPGVAASISVDGNMIVSGISTFGDDITFTGATSGRDVVFDTSLNQMRAQDNAKLCAGTSSDLEIYHNSTNSYIDNYTGHIYVRNNLSTDNGGNIYLQAKSGEDGIIVNDDGAVELYHDDSKKLETASGGVTVTGTLAATAVTGDGSGLTGIVAIPSGGIILWSGAANAIPSGFVLCDGNNSTPDLRNRFVVGAGDSYAVDATGGATTDSISISISGNTGQMYASGSVSGNQGAVLNSSSGHKHSFSGSGSATVDTLPPYYALCYIMKT